MEPRDSISSPLPASRAEASPTEARDPGPRTPGVDATARIGREVGLAADGVNYRLARPSRRWRVPNRTAPVGRAYAFGVLVADVWPPAPARRTRRPSTGPAHGSGPGRAGLRTASAAPAARAALAGRGHRQDHHDYRGRLFVHLPGGRRLATAPVRLIGPAAGNGARGTEKPFQSRGPQAERRRELLDGAALWSEHPAPLDVADRSHTDLGTPGEFLMRESHFTTKRPQHAPECRIPLLCLRHVTPQNLGAWERSHTHRERSSTLCPGQP